jgi:hypothetical protein
MFRGPPGGGVISIRRTLGDYRLAPAARCPSLHSVRSDTGEEMMFDRQITIGRSPARSCRSPGRLRGDSVGGGRSDDKPRNAEPYRPRSDNSAGDGDVLAIRHDAHPRLREHQRTSRASRRQSHNPRERLHERVSIGRRRDAVLPREYHVLHQPECHPVGWHRSHRASYALTRGYTTLRVGEPARDPPPPVRTRRRRSRSPRSWRSGCLALSAAGLLKRLLVGVEEERQHVRLGHRFPCRLSPKHLAAELDVRLAKRGG